MECGDCKTKLTKRQEEIMREIDNFEPCWCGIVKRIDKLEKRLKRSVDG